MKRIAGLAAALGAVAMVLAACGGDDDGANGAAKSPTPATTTVAGATRSAPTTAASPSATSNPAGQGKVPDDPCALLTLADVKKLIPTAGDGKASKSGTPTGQAQITCHWEASDTVASLDLTVLAIPAGATAQFKTSLQAEIKTNGRELQGIGDFAVVESPIAASATVRVIVKGLLVDLEFLTLGARDKQEPLIALAKLAVANL